MLFLKADANIRPDSISARGQQIFFEVFLLKLTALEQTPQNQPFEPGLQELLMFKNKKHLADKNPPTIYSE